MKKLLFGILFLSSIFCLMAEPLPFTQEDSSYEIINNDRTIQVAFYGSEYLSEYIYKEIEVEKAIVELRQPIRLSYPSIISIKITSSNIENADPIKWLFILQDGNKQEIYRKNGEHQIPILNNGLFGIGKNYEASHFILLLNKPVDFPLYLRIVNPEKAPIDITIIKK